MYTKSWEQSKAQTRMMRKSKNTQETLGTNEENADFVEDLKASKSL